MIIYIYISGTTFHTFLVCNSGPGSAATLPICFTAGRKPPALWDCLPKFVGIKHLKALRHLHLESLEFNII